MADFKIRAILEAEDRTGPAIKSAEQNIAEMRGEFAELSDRLNRLPAEAAGAGGGFQRLGDEADRAGSRMQGTSNRAADLIKSLRRFIGLGSVFAAVNKGLADLRKRAEEAAAAGAANADALQRAATVTSSAQNRISAVFGLIAVSFLELFNFFRQLPVLAKKAFAELNVVIGEALLSLPLLGSFFEDDLTRGVNAAKTAIIEAKDTMAQLAADQAALKDAAGILRSEILGLTGALRDNNDEAERSGPIITVYRNSLAGVGEAAIDAANGAAVAADQFATVSATSQSATGSLARAREEARVTALEFDRLAESLGRVAAVEAALAGGGRLSSNGRRIRLAGGGSRLTSSPGLSSQTRESRFASGQSTLI